MKTKTVPSGVVAREQGRTVSVRSGPLFGEASAKKWVSKLDDMNNEQLADVLAFIIGKLCPNYHSRPAGRE